MSNLANIRDTTNIMASVFNIEDRTYQSDDMLHLDNDVIVFDSSNTRLGIGISNPNYSLDVSGTINASNNIIISSSNSCTISNS